MKHIAIGFLLIASVALQAQILSQADFESKLPETMRQLAAKIRSLVFQIGLKPYKNDSLTTVLSLEDAYNMGSQLVVRQLFRDDDPDPKNLIDTAWVEPFSESLLLGDFAVNYSITTATDFSTTRKMRGIAPLFNFYFPNGICYAKPLFWINSEELLPMLSQSERELLQCFSWWKSFEPSHYFNNSDDQYGGLQSFLGEATSYNYYTLGQNLTGIALSLFITNNIRFRAFQSCSNNLQTLYSNNKPVKWNAFFEKHKRMVFTHIQNELNPDDPTDLVDTFYFDLPQQFDSVDFVNNYGIITIIFHQKHYNQTTGAFIGWADYQIPLDDARRYLHPAEQKIIELMAKN